MNNVSVARHVPAADSLGEGVIWDWRRNRLLWTDIPNCLICWLDDGAEQRKTARLPDMTGFIALADGGGYYISAGRSIYRADSGLSAFAEHYTLNTAPDSVRINDGKADRHGGLVFGTLHIPETEPCGGVYHASGAGVQRMTGSFTVFNGPAFSPDGSEIYFTDSPAGQIRRAAYHPETGIDESSTGVFAAVPEEAGFPDGMTTDQDGYLWSAHWDGARLTRYAPDGQVDITAPLPVSRPTSVCFAGDGSNTAFVTSAAPDEPAARVAAGSIIGGDVLRLDVNAQGLNECEVNFTRETGP